jgi:hypothetical protein
MITAPFSHWLHTPGLISMNPERHWHTPFWFLWLFGGQKLPKLHLPDESSS